MPTITASAVIARAANLLQDDDNVRWPQAELLRWLNDGQREMVLLKPNISVRNSTLQLASGTKQAIPADCISLVNVRRNMGITGVVPGRAVRIVAEELLDAVNPDWHSSKASAVVEHYTHSILDPKTFYVYPPQPVTTARGYVELVCVFSPVEVLINGVIGIDDIYMMPLVDYIAYRAFSKDMEGADMGRAQFHQTAYIAAMTGRKRGEAATEPTPTNK